VNQKATRDQIITALREGKSNTAIARELRADRVRVRRIRAELRIPNRVHIPQPLTLEQKWEANTRPDGGHLEWTGERAKCSGTPVLRYWPKSYSAAAVAFRIRTGRDPIGYVFAECGHQHCVAPEHVDDEVGRMRTREQLRYLTGGQARPEQCVHGHDQAQHGRYEADGRAYCEACKREQKAKQRQAVTRP
jgi:hypothetical protein